VLLDHQVLIGYLVVEEEQVKIMPMVGAVEAPLSVQIVHMQVQDLVDLLFLGVVTQQHRQHKIVDQVVEELDGIQDQKLQVVQVVPVLFSLPILHKYTQGYIPINNKNIYSL